MSATNRPREQVYAVVRDDGEAAGELRFTVKEIVWTLAEAEAEVTRLNAENGAKACRYSWQATRLYPPGTSAGRGSAPDSGPA